MSDLDLRSALETAIDHLEKSDNLGDEMMADRPAATAHAHKLTTVSKVAIIRAALGDDRRALGCLNALVEDFHRYREALERVYQTGKGVHVEIAREALNRG